MSLYFGETEMQGLHFGDMEITGLYFSDTEIWAAWAEYDGTLPAQYTANGSMLADYRVYGSTGGVGNRTENIYDWTDMSYGYEGGRTLSVDGTTTVSSNWCVSSYIEVKPSVVYTINWYVGIPYQSIMCEYDENYNFIGSVSEELNKTFTTSSQTKYLRLSNTYRNVERSSRETCVLVEGSTAPASYVPYGYVVPMSVSDSTASTTTPIYIGSNPLEADEYVDYRGQKVYRRTENLYNSAKDIKNQLIYPNNGYSQYITDYDSSDYIPISEGTYTISLYNDHLYGVFFRVNFYQSPSERGFQNNLINTKILNGYVEHQISIAQSGYIRLGVSHYTRERMLNIGEAIAYQPYLQPTDPPVPLPALPTCNGETITDYVGQSAAAPSRFYAKYKKGGQST